MLSTIHSQTFCIFYREAMTPSSLAESAEEDVCVSLCGSVANYFYVAPWLVFKFFNLIAYVTDLILCQFGIHG